jgi:hypothetical protein
VHWKKIKMAQKEITLNFKNNSYKVSPNFSLIMEIEEELGNICVLHHDFCHKKWKICDLVSLIHMMLASVGVVVDYQKLGNHILKQGIDGYCTIIKQFLALSFLGRKDI